MLFCDSYFAALCYKLEAPGPSVPVILETNGCKGETRYAVFNYKEANVHLKYHRKIWRPVIHPPKLTESEQSTIDTINERKRQQAAWIKERQEQRRNGPSVPRQSYQQWLQGLRTKNRTTN